MKILSFLLVLSASTTSQSWILCTETVIHGVGTTLKQNWMLRICLGACSEGSKSSEWHKITKIVVYWLFLSFYNNRVSNSLCRYYHLVYGFGHHHQILPLVMMPKVVFENLGKIVCFCYSALYSPSWNYKPFSVLYYWCLRWWFVT